MAKVKKYTVQITYFENYFEEILEIKTNNIRWSITQYQRNRTPFNWKVLKEEEL